MTKENVIDLATYQSQVKTTAANKPISNELEQAIQLLIHQLRELGPLQNSG